MKKNSTSKDQLAQAEPVAKTRKPRKTRVIIPPAFVIIDEAEYINACSDCADALLEKMKKTPTDTLIFKAYFEVPGTYGMYIQSYKIDLKAKH